MLIRRMEDKEPVPREPDSEAHGNRGPCKDPESRRACHEDSMPSTESKHNHLHKQEQRPPLQPDSKSHRRKRSRSFEDDEEGHLICHNGHMITERYEILSILGEGAFGRVVQCIDHSNRGAHVAVKIVKNADRYREAAICEVEVLQRVNMLNHDDDFAFVRMLDWFDHHGHICIVFELLGLSTEDFLKQNNFAPYAVDQIRCMAHQIFRAVNLLHQNKFTHTDLKPENILFVHSEYPDKMTTLKNTDVKLIDFGTTIHDQEYHNSLVSTRHYRAPEIVLELGWDHSCDVWSLGCILIEYYLGMTLFQTHHSNEHLAIMERVLGPIPGYLLERTKNKTYVYHGRLNWNERNSNGRYVRKHYKPLKQYMLSKSSEHEQLFDLIQKMLEYDPSNRITLEAALNHPFFDTVK